MQRFHKREKFVKQKFRPFVVLLAGSVRVIISAGALEKHRSLVGGVLAIVVVNLVGT